MQDAPHTSDLPAHCRVMKRFLLHLIQACPPHTPPIHSLLLLYIKVENNWAVGWGGRAVARTEGEQEEEDGGCALIRL